MGIHEVAILFVLIFGAYSRASSFGLLTVTHSRNGDFSIIQKYLKTYAQTSCYGEFITEINLVWNNQVPPESTPIISNQQNWKIPVKFFRTTFNSMDHRYRLPKDSTAQLLYSLDDDIIVDCNTFKITLSQYNKVANGRLGRIVSNEVRGYKFQPSLVVNGQFAYQGHAKAQFFTISQPGAAFIPRHYLQLYYLRINELLQLRNEILEVKNCDDIFFYAFVQHFYPELPAVYVSAQKDYKNTDPKVGQSKVKNVYKTRSKCIDHISQAMGYNPLRFFSKNSTQYLQNWSYDNLQMILEQKIRGFNEVQLQKAVERSNQQDFEKNEAQSVKKVMPQEAPITPSQQKNDEIIKKDNQKQASQDKQSQKNLKDTEMSKIVPKNNQSTLITQKKPVFIDKSQQAQETKPKPQKKEEKIQLKLTFEQQLGLEIFLLIILIILCFQLYKKNCDKKMQYRISLQQEEETHSMSIRLPERF